MDFDPSIIEIISGVVLLLLGGSTGYGVSGKRGENMTNRLADIHERLAELFTRVEGLIKGDLAQLHDRSQAHENALRRHDEDIENLHDALTIYMTATGDSDTVPERTYEAIVGKLHRRRGRGITGPAARREGG